MSASPQKNVWLSFWITRVLNSGLLSPKTRGSCWATEGGRDKTHTIRMRTMWHFQIWLVMMVISLNSWPPWHWRCWPSRTHHSRKHLSHHRPVGEVLSQNAKGSGWVCSSPSCTWLRCWCSNAVRSGTPKHLKSSTTSSSLFTQETYGLGPHGLIYIMEQMIPAAPLHQLILHSDSRPSFTADR